MIADVLENRRLSRWAALLPRAPNQVGAIHETDAELVPLGDGRLLALTVDTVAEEIRLGLYREPYTAGRIAALASLSDLAAVGADPIGLLLAVTLPAGYSDSIQEEVARGVAEVCAESRTFVLGGDTSEAEELSISVTAAGQVPEGMALGRVGCKAGDLLFCSGPLGAGAGLAAASFLGLPRDLYPEGAFRPPVRLAQGKALRGLASACMDTSDGLVATVDQLSRLNGVAIHIERPLEEVLEARANVLRVASGLPTLAFLASHHGEFELVFTLPAARLPELERRADQIGWRPVSLGRVGPGLGLTVNGRPLDGARVRNLLAEVGGNVAAYVRALCALEG
jgi:thiamine-monophosphate kinase